MNITLVIASLTAGGAERIMSVMANYWAAHGWPVTLLTLDDGSEPPFFELHPAVHHRALGIAGRSGTPLRALGNNLGRVRRVRQAIVASAPDAVIAFMDQTNVITLLATRGLGLPVIVAEHTDPHCSAVGRVWRLLRQWSYPWATHVVALSKPAMSYFSARVQAQGRIFPNPVVLPAGDLAAELPAPRGENRRLLAMGRLSPIKGFDLLIQAFARIAPQHPTWSLEIWGEGPARTQLETLRDDLGLTGRVLLPGRTRQPITQMRTADLFVLSSRHEGFPTVVCEALACGVPVVSFDCPSGPREIIRDGVDGVLVPAGDIPALATALDHLMSDSAVRLALAQHGPEVLERFGLDKIMGLWETLLLADVQPRSTTPLLHELTNGPGRTRR